MPAIGEEKYGHQIGHSHKSSKFRWVACIDCGKERWVLIQNIKGIPKLKSDRCLSCSALKNSSRGASCVHWRGGIWYRVDGYIMVRLQPDDPYYEMATDSYVMEHRLIMAKHLGRCLSPQEVVHHEGIKYPLGSIENRRDNRLANLRLFRSNGEHMQYHRSILDESR